MIPSFNVWDFLYGLVYVILFIVAIWVIIKEFGRNSGEKISTCGRRIFTILFIMLLIAGIKGNVIEDSKFCEWEGNFFTTGTPPILMAEAMEIVPGQSFCLGIEYQPTQACDRAGVSYVPRILTCITQETSETWPVESLPFMEAPPLQIPCGDWGKFPTRITGTQNMPKGESICIVEFQNVRCGKRGGICLQDTDINEILINVP